MEDIKEKISDNEYKTIMDNLMNLHNNNSNNNIFESKKGYQQQEEE